MSGATNTNKNKNKNTIVFRFSKIPIFVLLVFGIWPPIRCAGEDSSTGLATSLINDEISNFTEIFRDEIKDKLGFCVKELDDDWNGAFNFNSDLTFISNCIKQINGDVTQRLCTAAEIRSYFRSFADKKTSADQILRPNKNCNMYSWVSGCESGWASAANTKGKVDLKNTTYIPPRTTDSQPCCEGFYCPEGITCMIPCPLGSYCPRAKLNETTGICDPYGYQLPPGKKNHTCGGADTWADVATSSEIFCSAGSYCKSTTKKSPCSSGNYCRKGSTVETSCFKLSTCNKKTATQDIHVYGVILIGGLTIVLIIIYGCSDKVISIRRKRLAKSREAAARSARETAQARQRWRTAKDIAKKGGGGGGGGAFSGLQQQLSRTFSRKTTNKKSDFKIPGQAKPDNENLVLPPSVPTNPSSSKASSSDPKSKKKEPSNLTKMLNSIEDNPESNEGFNLQIGDKNIKKQQPKAAKALHSHSQIFKYAYGQLEKEKAQQQKNKMTFSGIISMATDEDVRTRPPIEISFQNLTLTLKGKRKHLLRCVSGKIMPGRISAVMGPSGAGKTTFLSALAGKVSGCVMSGVILINGKNESIHCYKRIIGFVPQDDVVHGNLTVEENLRFSARCRLAKDMPKADKVLVVERVIDSLGLQNVRDSLVGTVEKRGISGGQRKRVNVGLEMVMEPSLLILDEPTSGLDSTSSNLLLRALRRESLEGVNISMVVHQPSYTLFKMFDDLILLAKGGLPVYHGSVKKVEEYFGGLGIHVPERINPPDHFIDILEGITKTGSDVTAEQLPVRWMLHNGYPVPQDMMHLCDSIKENKNPNADHEDHEDHEQSFAGDLWQDMVLNVEMQRDNIMHKFLTNRDLSNRVTPGSIQQYKYFLRRVTKQRLREFKLLLADYLILLLAGACLGVLAKVEDETFGALGYTYTVIAISLLCMIAALRSFAQDKIHYWRESSSGMSSSAYFMSKDTLDHFNTIVKPLIYLSMFYFFNNPRSTFGDNYVVLLCLVYCVTGIAYIFAILLEPGQAQLWCVLLPVVLTLISNQDKDSLMSRTVGKFCYPKWALEAFVIANAEKYSGVWLITRCGSLMERGYDLKNWTDCLVRLILSGILSRLLAFLCLLTFQKKG